ncbi:M17 family peptidase N-terminal domain-containing protein, partial [Bacillus sp. SIMBA_161]
FGIAGKRLVKEKIRHAAIYTASFENGEVNGEQVAHAAAEGIQMGAYRFADYKTNSSEVDHHLESLSFLTEQPADAIRQAAFVGTVHA